MDWKRSSVPSAPLPPATLSPLPALPAPFPAAVPASRAERIAALGASAAPSPAPAPAAPLQALALARNASFEALGLTLPRNASNEALALVLARNASSTAPPPPPPQPLEALALTLARSASSTSSPIAAAAASPLRASAPLAEQLLEFVLGWAVISLGAYLGVLVRIGFSYYKGAGPTPSGFTVLFAELAGCFIMGVASEFQTTLTGPSASRLQKLAFVFVATGLCGSITTFSTWMLECAKLLLADLDVLTGAASSGERAAEYLASLWIGVSLPLAALVVGQHLAQALVARSAAGAALAAQVTAGPGATGGGFPPKPATAGARIVACCSAVPEWAAVALILLTYILATAAVVASPLAFGWPAIAWATLLGAPGAFLRFQLSPLNRGEPLLLLPAHLNAFLGACADGGNFPVGTFLANILGCLVQAITVLAAKFLVSFHNEAAQAQLYAMAFGFCGCFTTLSTFALELARLPRGAAYGYALVSNIVAQVIYFGLLAALGVTLASAVKRSEATDLPHMDICSTFPALCTQLLDHVGCALPHRVAVGCSVGGGSGSGLQNFNGTCSCGGLEMGAYLRDALVDAQTAASASAALVAVWPTELDGSGGSDATQSVDICSSYSVLCANVLSRLDCAMPGKVSGCAPRQGLTTFSGRCTCGAVDVSDRVSGLLVGQLLARRYDLLALSGGVPGAGGFLGAPLGAPFPLDLCASATQACEAFLDHALCPMGQRGPISGCSSGEAFDYATFVSGCGCFGNAALAGSAGAAIEGAVLDAIAAPQVAPRVSVLQHQAAGGGGNATLVIDACASYDSVCRWLLDSIGCPLALRPSQGVCSGPPAPGAGPPPPGAALPPDSWAGGGGSCSCGQLLSLPGKVRDLVLDTALSADLASVVFVPPLAGAFELMASSNPFAPLLLPNADAQ